jgi:hypothetical protein
VEGIFCAVYGDLNVRVCVAGVEQLMKCHSCYLLCFNLDGMGLIRSIPQKRLG